jgi:GNAT superfamily N-acetyltransferase
VDFVIRPPHVSEIPRLGEIERDGDRRYRGDAGVPDGFDDAASPAQLRRALADGRLWVAVVASGGSWPDGDLIGFALAEPVDGNAHLEQLSVALAFQGRGVGRRLIDTVCAWARDQAMAAVTLCTFSDVVWNRPLYEHMGFVVLPEHRWTPELRAVFESDAVLGLELSRRVVMRRDLAES